MEVNVLNISGAETGRKIQLPETIFGIEPNDHAIYLDVKQYRANLRQGTHSTKVEVRSPVVLASSSVRRVQVVLVVVTSSLL